MNEGSKIKNNLSVVRRDRRRTFFDLQFPEIAVTMIDGDGLVDRMPTFVQDQLLLSLPLNARHPGMPGKEYPMLTKSKCWRVYPCLRHWPLRFQMSPAKRYK